MNDSKSYTRNIGWLDRAKKVIPGATSTYSKGYRYYCEGEMPAFVLGHNGCYLYDVDGNKFVDWVMGLGSNILGYSHHYIGPMQNYTINDTEEVVLAEKICELYPSAEMVRFLKTGSGACEAAVKVARAYTGRDEIVSIGYHGWSPDFTPDCEGTLECVKARTLLHLPENLSSVACVVLEPIQYDPYPEGYLSMLRQKCDEYGTVLVFDEVLSGFRYGLGGYQSACGITPDLTVLGKAMGNGAPISCLCGKRELMEIIANGKAFVSTTFGGETYGIRAALDTISVLETRHSELWKRGEYLQGCLKEISPNVIGYPTRLKLECSSLDEYSRMQVELGKRGFLTLNNMFNLSLAHDKSVIDKTVEAYCEVLESTGPIPSKGIRPVFVR